MTTVAPARSGRRDRARTDARVDGAPVCARPVAWFASAPVRPLVWVLASVLLASGLVIVGSDRAEARDTLQNFGPENEGAGPVTRRRAIRHARAYDVITARPLTYEGHVAAMKDANARLILAAYVSGTFLPESMASGVPEDRFAHDAAGRRIRSRLWSNFLMDPADDGWVRSRVEQCRYHLRISRYNACFVDMLGTEPLTFDYLTSLPVNPETRTVWTKDQWLDATSAIVRRVKAAIAPKRVVINGVGSGWRYFDRAGPTRRLLARVNIGMAEEFVRAARASLSLHRTESMWKQDVEMLIDAGQHGDRILAFTKVWLDASPGTIRRWHQFALATFLLGSDGSSYFAFSSRPGLVDPHHWWRARLGSPKAPYRKSDGVYQRAFARGRVLANPTGLTHTVRFRRTFRTLSGDRIRSIRMRPYTGAVLRFAS